MGSMGGALPITTATEQIQSVYTYETVATVEDVAEKMQHVIETQAAQVALVTITLRFDGVEKAQAGKRARMDQSARYLLDTLRTRVRKTDVVCLCQHTFYFILLGSNVDGGKIVQERLWEVLLWQLHNAGELLKPRIMEIGHSAYPAPQDDAMQCIQAAISKPGHVYDLSPEKATHKDSVSETPEALPALARKLGIPYLSLLPRKLPARVQQIVSPQLAQELHCYPLGRERDTLTVAIADPQDQQLLERLRQITGLRIFPVLAPPSELQTAIEVLFQFQNGS